MTDMSTCTLVGYHCTCYVITIDVCVQIEDEQEKFERLQKSLLQENPDSAAFYNAKLRIQRRVSAVNNELTQYLGKLDVYSSPPSCTCAFLIINNDMLLF